MAARLKINHRILSRLKYEHGAGLADETLVNIVGRIGEDTDEKARFLASYLRDRMVGPDDVLARIHITVDEPACLNKSSSRGSAISEATAQIERVAIKNPRVCEVLLSLSRLAASC